ncbi:MAG: flagellar M-ring protein FliF [Gemmatimonadaceae bacterium]|nr:flagellar M-ring protein FliF [Gemmatimonadaceae bacterium]
MFESLNPLFDRLGGVRRAMTLGVGVLAIGLIVVVSRWATRPALVPVVAGVPLEQVDGVTRRLTQEGVTWELGRGGTDVMVKEIDLARARVALAKDGMPSAGRPGMEIFDKPAYAMTDFTQRINYRRALEGELERTIGQMRGIAGAQVHLAIHETSTFRRSDTPSEASVVLRLRSNEEPSPDVVRGIAQMVASSVDGLDAEHVTVNDDAGRLLSRPVDASATGLSSRQLELQREIEEHFRTKAAEMVNQVVGTGNGKVAVTASVNFDRLERTTQTVDPERQVTATEQKAEIVPGAQGGAGSTNQAIQYENSRSTESFAQAVGSVQRLNVSVLVNDRLIGTGDSARSEPRSVAELARLDTLVRSAVGYDSTRGDRITVVSVPFARPEVVAEPAPPAPTLIERVQVNQGLILNSGALVFAFVIGFMALRSMRAPANATALAAATGAAALPTGAGYAPAAIAAPERFDYAALPSGPEVHDGPRSMTMTPELAALQANQETKHRVATTVDQQPEVAAKLIRAWMKEA